MNLKIINPSSLGPPRGYSNGVLAEANGKLLFIAGQIGADAHQEIFSDDFVQQFDQALANVIAVVAAAGGTPSQIARIVIYVIDKTVYQENLRQVGECYRARMGKHFPAMALVEVKGLLAERAQVEMEAMAVL